METIQIKTTINLSTKQLQALRILQDKETTELLYGGGAYGGKSFLGCFWLATSCLKYSGSRWFMGRAHLTDLKKSTLLTFFDVCKKLGLNNKHFKYNSIENKITFINSSEIYLKDLFAYPSDPEFDSLGSTEYTGGFADEISEIKVKAKNILMSRIRYKLDEFGLIPKFLIGTNPCKHWAYTEFYKLWRDKRLPKYRKFIQALPYDNPFGSQHYIDNLKKLDEVSRQRLLHGNWEYDDDPSKLLEYDEIVDLFTNQVIPDPKDKYLSCDVARLGKNKTVVGIWYGFVCKIRIKNVKAISRVNETVDLLKEIEQEEQIRRGKQIVDEDGVGGGVVDYHPGCIGFVNNSSPIEVETEEGEEKQRIKQNYRNLKTQCSYKFAELAKRGEIKIICDSTIKEMIIEEIEQLKRKNIEKESKIEIVGKDEIKESIGRSPDFLDMLVMRMRFLLTYKKEAFFEMA